MCATFWSRGPDKERTVLAGHIVSKYLFFIIYLFLFSFLCAIDDNTLSPVVPVLE